MTFEDLQIGQTASTSKTITEADILLFAAVSTDTTTASTTVWRSSITERARNSVRWISPQPALCASSATSTSGDSRASAMMPATTSSGTSRAGRRRRVTQAVVGGGERVAIAGRAS